ncbi:hypothetical protein [Shewanella algae]|uniref:hypothetical protein n=1 Tax=Shewanella algae TaxID=38313 RepID=UPI0031F57FB1
MTTTSITNLHPKDREYITTLAHKDWSESRPLNYIPVVLHLPRTKHKAKYLLAGLTHYYAQRTAARPLPEPIELYLDIIKSIAADTAKERRELGQAVYTRFKAISPDPLSDYFKGWLQNKPGDKTDHEYHQLDLWLIAQGKSTQTRRKPRSTKPKRKTPGRPRIHYEPEQLQEYIAQHNIENRTQIQKSNRSLYDFFMRRENRHIINEILPVVIPSGSSSPSTVMTTYTEEQLREYIKQNNIENRAQLKRTNLKMYNFFNRDRTRALLHSVLPSTKAGRRKGTGKSRWNLERIRQIAVELGGDRSLFHKKCGRGYKWLMNNGYSELYNELFSTKITPRLPVEELRRRASKYATKGSLMKSEPAVYRQLYKWHRELLNELFEDCRGRGKKRLRKWGCKRLSDVRRD